ncbi:general amino acid permease 1 [Naematelia encephala]|uniref:General amino acid permease 1 n=1 Tax=Naematelia encephala TaxID=71784 RepID=A0A1Y2AEM7_9TREE|nr:general amino acid permease 1 [Naematelia encephala]
MSEHNIDNVEDEKNVKDIQPALDDVNVLVNEAHEAHEEPADIKIDVHTHIYDGVHRKMKQRHMQMIGLAGTLGTGLFLGSGKTIRQGGPLGALLAYIQTGSMSYCMLMSLGEMAVYAPISGGYIHYAERWLHPSVGFALGWQAVLSHSISLPNEIISGSILIEYWDANKTTAHTAAYLTVLMILCAGINFFGARWFGESEFWFSLIKILLIVGLILAGLIVDLGGNPAGDRIGFRYWKDPGPFVHYLFSGSKGQFAGWFTDLLQAAYSFLGMESIAIAAGEVQNPRVSVTKAIKRVFIRICLFYVLGILIVGMLVPSNDKQLLAATGTTAASSPFVIAFSRVGIKALPSIINACVLTSAFSAGNTGVYISSRMLYGLALRGQAPKIFSKTTRGGLPIIALTFVVCFMPLSYMALASGAQTVLNWLTHLTSLSGILVWGTIAVTYIRFKKAVDAQGIDRKKFYYYNRFQPWPAYWVVFSCSIVILFNGWQVFTKGNWNSSNFVVAYINLPLFFGAILGHWLLHKRPKFVKPVDLDMFSNIPSDQDVSYEEPPAKNWFHKVVQFLFT